MSLIKDIQDKNYVVLKDYVGERIASIVAGKINSKKEEFLSNVRSISEKENPFAKKDDDSDKDKDKDKKKDAGDKEPKKKEKDEDDDEDDEDKE